MPTVKTIIDGHNKKILEGKKKNEEQQKPLKTCNCRKPDEWPTPQKNFSFIWQQ